MTIGPPEGCSGFKGPCVLSTMSDAKNNLLLATRPQPIKNDASVSDATQQDAKASQPTQTYKAKQREEAPPKFTRPKTKAQTKCNRTDHMRQFAEISAYPIVLNSAS